MRFLAFIPLATKIVATTSSENLFSDNSPDNLAVQDSPQESLASQDLLTSQDLLASQDLPASQNLFEDSELTTDDNNDLFPGSDTDNFPSTEPQELSPDLEASCSIENEQPLNKLRSRDGAVCPPNGPAPLKKEPTQDKLGDIFRKIKEFFEYPPDEDLSGFPKYPPPFRKCRPDFPLHLCCDTPGDRTLNIGIPGSYLYDNFFGCYPASDLPCVESYDVCCQFFAPNSESNVLEDLVGATCYIIPNYVYVPR